MREITASTITEQVAEMCQEANIYLGDDVINALKKALVDEESPAGKEVLKQLIENVQIARNEKIPICQDTGFAVFFVEWGQEVHLTGGSLEDAINEGVRRGYREGYLRKSIVGDPLERINTGDNTPAVIHTSLVPGDRVKITFAPKGGGSENMSTVKMLKPSDGVEGVVDFVVNHVRESGSNPCPPIVVGAARGTLIRWCCCQKGAGQTVGRPHPKPFYASLEQRILKEVKSWASGPGLWRPRYRLAVHIETSRPY